MSTLRSELHTALVEAFPTLDDLDQLVQEALHINRARITTSSGLDAIVDDLLSRCVAERRVAALMCMAYNRNPNNLRLSRLVSEAGAWPELTAAGLTLFADKAYGYASRAVELTYLDLLIQQYRPGTQQYTELAGIAEVEEGQEEEPLPPEFQRLADYGLGPERRVERVPVADVREAVDQYRRLVILGEPGSGKSTTLQHLTVEYARAARSDPSAPLPLYVELGRYKGSEPILEFICDQVRALADHIPAYLHHGRAFLFLDGLNEMPRLDYAARVQQVQALLTQFRELPAVVTCRVLDYVGHGEALKLEKLEIQPLDVERIRVFSHRYLGEAAGETLFAQLADETALHAWQQSGGNWIGFVQAAESDQRRRRGIEVSPLLLLASNPYMLRLLTVVFRNQGALPASRGKLFNAYTGLLWEREQRRQEKQDWPGEAVLMAALTHLASVMQMSGERGTAVDKAWAIEQLAALAVPPDRVLYLAASANLVDLANEQVRFVHQLVQEYFAALAMRTQLEQAADVAIYWPRGWVRPSGWEETAILLAGMLDDMTPLVEQLLRANPPLAARAIAESGGEQPAAPTVERVQETLVRLTTGGDIRLAQRLAAGNALNILGDPRPGVGVTAEGLPDIVWCPVPESEFTMGNTKQTDEMAFDNEVPQHELYLDAFSIARYPITNAQYEAFIRDGGYSEQWRHCWTEAGWRWRVANHRSNPSRYRGAFDLSNHPVLGITWHEAVAFSNWLSQKLGQPVRLPTEAEWEKAARGADGRRYPWGGQADPNRANYEIGTTSPVGCFPGGASPYGCEEMAGNVWEWTSSKYIDYPYNPSDGREDPEGDARRVLRGGSFNYLLNVVRCAGRYLYVPDFRNDFGGFRVVVHPPGCCS
jgi:formylglycine-generating enzyme required for sulfatase activity